MSLDSFLVIRNLTVTFSRWGQTVKAIDDVTLTIPQGQWVILAGHNGSGKTTLLKAISGRQLPDKGDVSVKGCRTTEMSSAEMAGSVFHVHQDPLLGTAPTLTIFENLLVADDEARRGTASRSNLLKKYGDLLEPLGLKDRLKQLARTLSGGERQLLALLIARLRPSVLVLLDEPLAALDPVKAELCLEQIRKLHEAGKTILQVTHDPETAVHNGNRTVALANGRIVYDELEGNREPEAIKKFWNLAR